MCLKLIKESKGLQAIVWGILFVIFSICGLPEILKILILHVN